LANVIPDQTVKQYFSTGTRKIVKVRPGSGYILTMVFDNGEIKVFDMSDHLFGVFEILKDDDRFREVFIDEHGNLAWEKDKTIDSKVVWNNRIDVCKDFLYMASTPSVWNE
jgi:hypothetical protein